MWVFRGETIYYKFLFSALLLIFILSLSAVSAELIDNEDSLTFVNANDLIYLAEDLNSSDNLSDNFDNLNEESESDSTDLDDSFFNNHSSKEGSDTSSSDDASEIFSDGEGPSSDDASEIFSDGEDSSSDDGTNDFSDDGNQDDGTNGGNDEETLKNTTLKIISIDDWKIYGNEEYIVELVDEYNNPITNAVINFKIKTPKETYIEKTSLTDDLGVATLKLDLSIRGLHNILVSYEGDLNYNPAESLDSNVILYEKTIIKTPKKYAYRSSNFTIKLVSSLGKTLSNKKLIIYVDGKKYTRTTDSKGQVYVKMPSDKKSVKFNCTFSGIDFYDDSIFSMKLPVYKKTYTKALVYAVLKGKYFKVLLKGIDGKILKKQKIKITIDGKNYTRTTNDKGIAYFKVKLKRNAYKIRFSYDNNGVYGPSSNSSTLNVIDPSGQFKKGLNQNTKLSVSKYLYGGGYAKITKSIRKLSKKITGKYSTKLEKATAIFNYVRDNLGYSYYANSRKGAAKTLKTKKGNCCDHANLIVALCRASKIPARYSHARGCKFKSGLVTGHVWAQIYVGGRWYSADGTSYKNSLGHISNWNTKSYHSYHKYRNIPF